MTSTDYWLSQFETATDGDVLCHHHIISWISRLHAEYRNGEHPNVDKFPRLSYFILAVENRYQSNTGNSIEKESEKCGC